MLLLSICVLILCIYGQASECHVEEKAWTLLQFHIDPKVEQSTHRQIMIDQTGLQKLQQLADTPLSIVSIIGVYRSGKSTLLNRLLPPSAPRGVFEVGHSVQAQTEEVSIYPVPPCALQTMKEAVQTTIQQSVQSPNHSQSELQELNVLLSILSNVPTNTTLVLCDSPGLASSNRNRIFDEQLLAIVNLMSSVVLYNSQGLIQRDAVLYLADAVDAASALSWFDVDSSVVIDRPNCIWVMQNTIGFDMLDRDRKPLSGKAYVQHVLNEIDSASGNTNYSAKLNHFFASIDSIRLPHPTDTTRDLARNNELTLEQLTPEYRLARAQLFSRVLALLKPKNIGNTVLNGATLSDMVTKWVENINVPTEHKPTPASELLANILSKEVSRLITKYESEMASTSFPVSDQQLRQTHERIVDSIKKSMKTDGQGELLSRFSQAAEQSYTKFVERNVGAIDTQLKAHAAAAEQGWKRQVNELKNGSPTSVQILQAEATALDQWRSLVRGLQGADPGSVSQYEASFMSTIKSDSQPLLFQAITNEKHHLVEHCDTRFNSQQLPLEPQTIEQIAKECLDEWMTSQSALNALDAERKGAILTALASAKDAFVESAKAKNTKASLDMCVQNIHKRGAELVRDSINWASDPQYQSRASLVNLLETLPSTVESCEIASRNNSFIQTEINKVRDQLIPALDTRIWLMRVFGAMLSVIALVDVSVARYLVSKATRSASSANYMLLNGGTSPHRSLSTRSRWVAILGSFVASPLLILSHLTPDAATGAIGILFNAMIVFVIVVGVLVMLKSVLQALRGKKHVR